MDAGLFNDDFLDLAVGAPTETVGSNADAGGVNVLFGSATQLPGPPARPSPRAPGSAAPPKRRPVRVGAGDRVLRYRSSDLAIGAPLEDVVAASDAGAVNVCPALPPHCPDPAGTFPQDSAGVGGSAEGGDSFGSALD
jgi:hypothetical protein